MLYQKSWYTILFFCLLIAVAVYSIGVGAVHITPTDIIKIFSQSLGFAYGADIDEGLKNIFLFIRLPRVVLGMLIGAGLAVSGVAMQGLFRNPLADPTLIGISAGASLSAVSVIVVFSSLPFYKALPEQYQYYFLNIVTFIGAALTSLLVFRMSRAKGITVLATLLLGGLAINAICRASVDLLTYIADDAQIRNATFWSMGSLNGATWVIVLSIVPFILIPVIVLPFLGKALNAFALGEKEAQFLGVNVKRLKLMVIVFATMAVGASVAVAGIIGFIGLIVPHIVRRISGENYTLLLVNSALFGATLLTLSDVLSRTIIAPAELPIGIITAFIGTPVFVFLLIQQKKQLKFSL
ncbi:FecCD family ABC transporter permease [Gynurincola endophyticus]|jgi:iron complex transport system permease protein|uniref:FecCD family ABC transporter permease n=1 Tax=Gynurincola endophyticus TaxID=2479004 RepID=UPI000F8E919B|nr:iron ABC transporter permease [Gynurincola endophyticus]